MVREKVLHAKAMGAEVVVTRSDVGKGHPDYYQDLAEAITQRTPGAFFINQFANPANPRAHETTTGPEILRQMDGDVDAIVVGVGSGGTLTGIGRFMRQASPKTEMILADPAGSVLATYVETGSMTEAGSWAVEGIGEDFVPPNADLTLVSQAYRDSRCGELCLRARPPARGGRVRRLLLGHAAGRGAALLPRADGSRSGSSAWSAIPAPNISPKCSIPRSWRRKAGSIRTDTAPCATSSSAAQRGHRRRRAPAGQSAHGVRAHALGRRLATAGDGRAWAGGRPGRRERRARRAAHGGGDPNRSCPAIGR